MPLVAKHDGSHPSKHETFTRCRLNAERTVADGGPTLQRHVGQNLVFAKNAGV